MLLHLDVKQTPDSFESEAFLTHICFTFFVLLYILIKYDSRSENYFGWKSSLLLLDFMMPREQHFWLNLNYTRKWSFNFFLCSTFLLRVRRLLMVRDIFLLHAIVLEEKRQSWVCDNETRHWVFFNMQKYEKYFLLGAAKRVFQLNIEQHCDRTWS